MIPLFKGATKELGPKMRQRRLENSFWSMPCILMAARGRGANEKAG